MAAPEKPDLPLDLLPVPGLDGWYRTAIGRNYSETAARVLALQGAPRLDEWQIVCGCKGDDAGHSIYVIHGFSPIELAREFRTGSHNAWPKAETDKVCEQLGSVFEIAPFQPYFIDAAGFKCRFIQPISSQQADAIERILTVGLEGYVSEWSGQGPIVADTVVAENGLRLWWD